MAGPLGSRGSWDGSTERLAAEAAELRVEEGARARARRASLSGQAAEEASLRGVLVDLGERGATVRLELASGRSLVGRVRRIGADVAVVDLEGRDEVLVHLAAVAALVPHDGGDEVRGDRLVDAELTFAEALGWLVADRPSVQVHLRGGAALTGELVSVGADVAVVRLEGDRRRPAYVAVAAVAEVLVEGGTGWA